MTGTVFNSRRLDRIIFLDALFRKIKTIYNQCVYLLSVVVRRAGNNNNCHVLDYNMLKNTISRFRLGLQVSYLYVKAAEVSDRDELKSLR